MSECAGVDTFLSKDKSKIKVFNGGVEGAVDMLFFK